MGFWKIVSYVAGIFLVGFILALGSGLEMGFWEIVSFVAGIFLVGFILTLGAALGDFLYRKLREYIDWPF